MVEPLSALACLPLSHSENFLKVTDELPVEVLDAPLDFPLVLRVRRKRKMSVDAGITAPFLPLLLELAAVIGENLGSLFCLSNWIVVSVIVNSWVKLLSTNLSTIFNALICRNAVLKSPTTHSTVKRSMQA
jgi:hypothetical protein